MRKIALAAMFCAVGTIAMAKPAYRGPITRTAEDGTEKTVFLHGNESFHYMTDEAGQWLDENTLRPLSEEMKSERLQLRNAKNSVRRAPQQQNGVGDEPNIAPRGLVVLVNFQDKAFTTPRDTFDAMLNSETFERNYSYRYGFAVIDVHAEGSVKRYFEDQSYGAYSPIFDVVGPVTVSRNMSYYGSNDSGGNDQHPEIMVKEACELASSDFGVDFTLYDNDNDGFVDFVYIIYAGYGEADGGSASTIWPHQWNLWDYGGLRYVVDGKILNRYACGCELSYGSKMYDGIGTICHEFSHVLGLPDLYSTDQSSTHKTMGAWDVMDYGPYNNDGNTPPSYSAYERFYMGWLTPRVLDQTPSFEYLKPINQDKGDAILLCKEDQHNLVGWNPNPKEFYLLEARTQEGWDEYLPGSGMLITRIRFDYNKWSNNKVNNYEKTMGVDLIEAKTNRESYGRYTDAYPAGKDYWIGLTDHEVTDIEVRDEGLIAFSFNGGTEGPEGVENVTTPARTTKVIQNGQILILRDGKTYNLLGTPID